MSILKRLFSKIMSLLLMPYDKALHFIAGFAIFLVSSLVLGSILGLITVVILAIGKETFDFKSYGKFDLADMVMTIIPAMIMVAYLAVI